MYDIDEDRINSRIREMLSEWIAREDWEPLQLIDWLQGYGMPAIGHDEEPYLWLIRGLPPENERYEVETKLSTRVRAILESKPDENRPGTRPDQVLYNLLMLCAGLSCPDQLADPLYAILERGVLKGDWLGVDLRYALQVALILNQSDNRLLPDWRAALENRKHDFLPGTEYEAFEGIRFMPPSSDERGEPALDAIGYALKVMATHLAEDEERKTEFRLLISKVFETYPGRPTWDIDLLHQASKNQWPDWAMQELPNMRHIPSKFTGQICHALRRCSHSSARAVAGILAHKLTFIEKKLMKDDPSKKEIEKAHEQSLRTLAVGASGRGLGG
jgi:hypothetical protein